MSQGNDNALVCIAMNKVDLLGLQAFCQCFLLRHASSILIVDDENNRVPESLCNLNCLVVNTIFGSNGDSRRLLHGRRKPPSGLQNNVAGDSNPEQAQNLVPSGPGSPLLHLIVHVTYAQLGNVKLVNSAYVQDQVNLPEV